MKRAVLVLMMVCLAAPLLAQADAPEAPKAREAVARFLQLTPDQMEEWNGLLAARQALVQPLREELRDVEGELKELLDGDNPDPTAIGTLVLEGKALREAIGDANRDYVEGFEAMLTEEQRGRLTAIRRAERLQPLFPAFRLFGLLGPDGPPPPPEPQP